MIHSYNEITPWISKKAWVAESAEVIGNVQIENDASVWYQSVIRGDGGAIRIGKHSNIQDQCILHCDPGHELTVGEYVSVGHGAILHGCTIHDHCLIGMGAIIMNGAVIEPYSIIAAGALVCENTVIPTGSLALGCPAKVKKALSEEQKQQIDENAQHYTELKEIHRR